MNNINDLWHKIFKVKNYLGIMTPFCYFGEKYTGFVMHTEDVDSSSLNFHHFGAPKTWYGVPLENADSLERSMRVNYANCKAYLRHKLTLLSPNSLRGFDIPLLKTIQRKHQFILTFPFGYHSGFNHGFNVAEAVNIADEKWIPYGLAAEQCKCDFGKANTYIPNISHKKLVRNYAPGL